MLSTTRSPSASSPTIRTTPSARRLRRTTDHRRGARTCADRSSTARSERPARRRAAPPVLPAERRSRRRSGALPATSNTTVVPPVRPPSSRRRTEALSGIRQREVGNRALEDAGPVERLSDVLVVIPAVEHADRHELAVRTRTFGRETLAVPLLRGHRPQRVEAAGGDRRNSSRSFAPSRRGRSRSTARWPCRCRCARAGVAASSPPTARPPQDPLGADHVRDVVVDRPARALRRRAHSSPSTRRTTR